MGIKRRFVHTCKISRLIKFCIVLNMDALTLEFFTAVLSLVLLLNKLKIYKACCSMAGFTSRIIHEKI